MVNKKETPSSSSSGLTLGEEEIERHISSAWLLFTELEQTHPSDLDDFHKGIHMLQKTLGMRILRRDYPNYWINKSKEGGCLKYD